MGKNYDSTTFVVSFTFDGEHEFKAWKLFASKDSRVAFMYHSVQKQCKLPQLGQYLYKR